LRGGGQNLKCKNSVWKTLCVHFFQKHIKKTDTVLDIAAGYCEFLNNINSKEKIGFDLNPDAKNFAGKDVIVINDSFFKMEQYLKNKKADIIFASNILEHLDSKEDVIQALITVYKNLSERGKLLVLQPNIKLTGGAYWDFIDHQVPLTEKSVIEVTELAGFKVLKVITRFLPYTQKSRIPKSAFLIWLYLKLMPLSGYFMGKQSFLVLGK
jgi:SAM-dependent methyltransferase